MCLLICIRRDDGGLAIAANRDEYYDRLSLAPYAWAGRPRILAGRDMRAGGTWLAVNEHGVLAAVTNRATIDGDDPTRPTRGQLPLLACDYRTAAQAAGALSKHLERDRYNGFNLFFADAADAFIVEAPGPRAAIVPLPPGLHVGANAGFNDPADVRVARAKALLADLDLDVPGDALVGRLQEVCRDHSPLAGALPLCIHGQRAGTRSSSIIVLSPGRRLERYLHAAGPPCEYEYEKVTMPW